jgi:hypothetical protein
MILTSDYHISENSERQKEYDFCINKNIKNPDIKKIIYFITDQEPIHIHNKIEYVKVNVRPTYRTFFEYVNNKFPGETIILSNLDIYFDETINIVKEISLEKKILALTRYELKSEGWTLFNENSIAKGCQDTWIFKSPINCADIYCDFTLGIPGCDNRIAYEFSSKGYDVINNCLTIKTYHIHNSNYRSYKINKVSRISQPYKLLPPTT